jgi:perosamine synthetase
MTTGEGGMVTTDDDDVAAQLRSLTNQGRADAGNWLEHDRLGWNYRLDDVSAAIGLGQVERLPSILADRAAVADRYGALLEGVAGITPPAVVEGDVRSWFVYPVLVDEGVDRDRVLELLWAEGVSAKPYLPAIHLQPVYRDRGHRPGELPVCESISRRSLAIPFFAAISPADQERVVGTLARAVEHASG